MRNYKATQVPLQYIHFKAEVSEASIALPKLTLGGLGPLLATNLSPL